jgi:hypothetical protein
VFSVQPRIEWHRSSFPGYSNRGVMLRHSPPFTAGVKNEGSYITAPSPRPYVLMTWAGTVCLLVFSEIVRKRPLFVEWEGSKFCPTQNVGIILCLFMCSVRAQNSKKFFYNFMDSLSAHSQVMDYALCSVWTQNSPKIILELHGQFVRPFPDNGLCSVFCLGSKFPKILL